MMKFRGICFIDGIGFADCNREGIGFKSDIRR